MKKLLAILILSFLFNNIGFAKEQCEPVYLANTKIKLKENICIKEKDINILKAYKENLNIINVYPKQIQKILDSKCGKQITGRKQSRVCVQQAAGGKVYEIFVRREDQYHARYPGKIIEGMSWFEILYLYKYVEAKKIIERYVKYGPDNYQNITEFGVTNLISKMSPKTALNMDKKKLMSIIKMNNGRLKMRKAIGLRPEDELRKVLNRQTVLANFLNKDKLKVKKIKVDPQLAKREKLLKKYKVALKKYREKLDDGN